MNWISKYRIKACVACLVPMLSILLGACADEKDGRSPDGGQQEMTVSIRIGMKPYGNVATRAVQSVCESDGLSVTMESTPYVTATRSGEEKETAVTHLWVLQYALTGDKAGLLIGKKEIATALAFGTNGKAEIDAALSYSNDCVVYFVANSPELGDATAIASYSAFRSMTYSYTSQDEFPMVGIYEGKVPASGIEVELERMTVSISLNLKDETPDGCTFTFKSVQLKSVPRKGSYYDWNRQGGVSNWLYPVATDDIEANDALFTDYAAVTTGLDATIAWYMPENRRGNTTAAIMGPKDKTMAVSPTYDVDSRGRSYSSHFVLKGLYDNGSDITEMAITFFPGDVDNLNSNFDLVRNTRYTINAVIKNIDDDDPRIVRELPMAKITGHVVSVGVGAVSPVLWGSGVAGAEIVAYFPVDDGYCESRPVTVPSNGFWMILEDDVPTEYTDRSLDGRTYKVVQTLDGCLPSKKALYSIRSSPGPSPSPGSMGLNIQFLGTED